MQYHAHVYWQNEAERERALRLRSTLSDLGCDVGIMWDQPIGPHPRASYQVNYTDSDADAVESLLASADLAVLLHEDTGDDLRDHTQGARWLGETLNLDLEWLEEYVRTRS